MTVRAAGGRRTGCATLTRCERQQQQEQSSQHQNCCRCDRVFSGVVRDAVGFKNFFDRAIRSTHPVEKVDIFDGMRRSHCSIEKVGIEKRHFFDCVRMHDLVFDRKSPFSIHRFVCIRIGPRRPISFADRKVKSEARNRMA